MSAPVGGLDVFLNTTTAMVAVSMTEILPILLNSVIILNSCTGSAIVTKLWCGASKSHPSIVSQLVKFLGRLTWENTLVIYYVSLAFYLR